METAVRKATRLEYLPPKQKHLITLKNLTLDNPSSIDSIMLSLEKRLKERSWIITYKVLAIVHFLMREGNSAAVIESVMRNPSVLDSSRIKNKTSAPASVQNIYLYRTYLDERIVAFQHLKRDYVKETSFKKEGRLRHLSVSEGLLKETSALQRQIENVLKCKFYMDEKDPAITLFAYRMTIEDLLALFQAVNEGVVNILENYFEMKKEDAVEALKIYKRFAQQTESTITHLKEARKYQNDLQMDIPTINHAPLSLATALEEYLNDDDSANNNNQPQAAPPQNTANAFPTSQIQVNNSAIQQQQSQPQFFSQPIQNQPLQLQPQFYASPYQPQLQTDIYGNEPFLSSSPTQASSPNSNPFLSISNPQPQPQQVGFSNSPYAQSSTGYGLAPTTNNVDVARSNTFSVGNTSNSGSHNPFRSLSINMGSNYQQPSQLITVAKPAPFQLPQQTGPAAAYHNPFSPATPPLTPNNQPFFNNNFMQPYQQQQQQQQQPQQITAPPFQQTSNPFLT